MIRNHKNFSRFLLRSTILYGTAILSLAGFSAYADPAQQGPSQQQAQANQEAALLTGQASTAQASPQMTQAGNASQANLDTIPTVLPPPPPGIQQILIHAQGGVNPPPPVPMTQNNTAFQDALPQSGLAMTPLQIQQRRELEVQSAMASHMPLEVDDGSSKLIRVSTEPGQSPQSIAMAFGYGVAISFKDITGKPWPVQMAEAGDPLYYSVEVPRSKTDRADPHNIVTVSPLKIGAASDLLVKLKGLSEPITLFLVPNRHKIDIRPFVQIEARGPMAAEPVFIRQPSLKTASSALMNAAYGIAPPGAKLLQTDGSVPGLQAWRDGNSIYVRAKATWIFPSLPVGSQQVEMGRYSAWKTDYTPLIEFSVDGRLVPVKLESRD